MAKISLSEGFSLISEGPHIFKITEVIYKEEYGKLEVNMVTEKGQKHTERFTFVSANGKTCEGGINAFSFFAKAVLNNYDLTEIDHKDLVDHYLKCTVVHDKVPSKKDPTRTVTFIKLTDKVPVNGFEETKSSFSATKASVENSLASAPVKEDTSFNLDDLLD